MSDLPEDRGEDAAMPYDPGDEEKIADILYRAEDAFLNRPGVTGVGLGQDDKGDDALTVYLRSPGAGKNLPKEFEGLTVIHEITGDIIAD